MDEDAEEPTRDPAAPAIYAPNTDEALRAFQRLTLLTQNEETINKEQQSAPVNRVAENDGRGDLSPGARSPQLTRQSSTGSMRAGPSPSPRLTPASRRTSGTTPYRPSSRGPTGGRTGAEDAVLPSRPSLRTAATVAAAHFVKELASHASAEAQTETLVILHEACYGHRFSRPRTSRAALSTIVERPERITAAILGVATAYVRLGSRHTGGLHPPGSHVDDEAGRHIEEEHGSGQVQTIVRPPFTVRSSQRKVGLLSDAVVTVHGKGWMEELQGMCHAAGGRLAVDGQELVRLRKEDSNGTPVQQLHEGDLYLCEESLAALQGAIGGVADAVDAVFNETLTKRAFVAVRPPGHHCSADYPSGFCWLNNVHVGIQYAAQTHGLTHAVILDFDLHHGDGSQDITWDRNNYSAGAPKTWPHSKKPFIGYYSLHDINSFPCEMGDRAKVQAASLCLESHNQSIWNVHLEPWSSEEDFSRLYASRYQITLNKARAFLEKETKRLQTQPKGGRPRSAVFISAGFDACQWEGAGMQRHGVNVPTSFYERFTRDAVALAHETATAAEGRVISVLEGGYSNRALTSGVLSHISGLCQPAGHESAQPTAATATGMPLKQEAILVGDARKTVQASDHSWWSSASLLALEGYESTEPAAPKRVRVGAGMPTFATPTEASMHRAIDPARFYRSMSGTVKTLPEPPADMTMPDVSWAAAAHALCSLLVPKHRTTTSCKAEDLAVPRTKKQRQSADAVLPTAGIPAEGRQLRDRKKTADLFSDDEGAGRQKQASRTNRRKTLDAPPGDGSMDLSVRPKRSSRRSSAVSLYDEAGVDAGPVPDVPAIPSTFTQATAASSVGIPKPHIVKKTRKSPTKPTANGIGGAVHRASPIPTPALSRSSTNGLSQASSRPVGATVPPSLQTQSSTASYATAPSTASGGDDAVDKLSTAVKRITLKAPTPEQHERWVREQLAAQKASKPAAPAATAAPRAKLAAAKTKRFELGGGTVPGGAVVAPQQQQQQQIATFRPAGIANGIVRGQVDSATRSSPQAAAAPFTAITTAAADGASAAHSTAESISRPAAMDISAVLNSAAVGATPRSRRSPSRPRSGGGGGAGSGSRSPSRPGSGGAAAACKPSTPVVFSSTGHIPFAAAAKPGGMDVPVDGLGGRPGGAGQGNDCNADGGSGA